MKRVSEVFDCWFESGSMPYAQQHYPFENSEVFENNFPADFIAEGFFYFSFTTPVVLLTKIRLENAHTFSDAIRLENRFPDNKTLLFILRLNNISEGDSIGGIPLC